ncbi:MAG: trypsin-like peptidase domain-containing protein [Proteobacteria bacterium]|nr:trypsin-like peptidase domain-containing protein [Pseudomonadota bacterium]
MDFPVERWLKDITSTEEFTTESVENLLAHRSPKRLLKDATRVKTFFKPDDYLEVMLHIEKDETPPKRLIAPIQTAVIGAWRNYKGGKGLTPDEELVIESIIIPTLRPSFDILRDTYETLPALWQVLNDKRGAMEALIRGIGRLNLEGHPSLTAVGTAFVCGDRLLLTNRHVAEIFTDRGKLAFTPGVAPSLDFKQEVGSAETKVVRIDKPVLILEEWDAAILHVDALPDGVSPLPLASGKPAKLEDAVATVIGYPAYSDKDDLGQQISIFRGTFNKKRLLPGRLKGLKEAVSFGRSVQALAHDCTTLGGNSGSALIDVESGMVAGLHFGGRPLVANYAVPTWELAGNAQARASGMQFA